VVFIKDPVSTDFAQRKESLYHALQEGRSAIVFQAIYPFSGNDWRVECSGVSQVYRTGDHMTLSDHCEMVVQLPASFPFRRVVRIWKDGEKVGEKIGADPVVRFPLSGPGVYRAEVWLEKMSLLHVLLGHEVPYILYNPIYAQ
jgi:hypothetical protein